MRRLLPHHIRMSRDGTLAIRAEQARQLLEECTLCPHSCRVNRMQGETGFCRAGEKVIISSAGPHFGEEDVLVGGNGSGTIFFGLCNLACKFCQNYELSHQGEGSTISIKELADIMLSLQRLGCHNVNFVSPTHYAAQIVQAVLLAAEQGLTLPLVYNSGGYDSLKTLELMDGVIDIYMPDLKFMDEDIALGYTGARNYPQTVKEAIREMHRQVGDLQVDEDGLAVRGLLVRHLVMPEGLAGTEAAMEFLAKEISPETFVNVMGQYSPYYQARHDPIIGRRVTRKELLDAVDIAKKAGLRRVTS